MSSGSLPAHRFNLGTNLRRLIDRTDVQGSRQRQNDFSRQQRLEELSSCEAATASTAPFEPFRSDDALPPADGAAGSLQLDQLLHWCAEAGAAENLTWIACERRVSNLPELCCRREVLAVLRALPRCPAILSSIKKMELTLPSVDALMEALALLKDLAAEASPLQLSALDLRVDPPMQVPEEGTRGPDVVSAVADVVKAHPGLFSLSWRGLDSGLDNGLDYRLDESLPARRQDAMAAAVASMVSQCVRLGIPELARNVAGHLVGNFDDHDASQAVRALACTSSAASDAFSGVMRYV